MPEPAHDFPFAYRLPTDVAAQIHGTAAVDTPLVEMGSPRRRLGPGHRAPQRAGPGTARRGLRPGWAARTGSLIADGDPARRFIPRIRLRPMCGPPPTGQARSPSPRPTAARGRAPATGGGHL